MAAKKKRSPAQIAATKKMLAGLKKYHKKNPTKKKTAKKKGASRGRGRPALSAAEKKRKAAGGVGYRSQATKQLPTKRLKKRRAKNIAPGAFPNPKGHTNYFVVEVSKATGKMAAKPKYFDGGTGWTTNKHSAAIWHSETQARKIAEAITNDMSNTQTRLRQIAVLAVGK